MASPVFGVSGTGTASNTTPMTAAMTSIPAGSVIVAQIYAATKVSGTYATVTGVTDTSGLTWQRRGGIKTATCGNMEIWWAYTAAAIASDTISIGLTGTYDDACVVVCTFTGCNTTNPWDSNPTLPAFVAATSGTAASISGISTTNPDDTLLCTAATNGSSSAYLNYVPSGFTFTAKASNVGGSNYALEGNGYEQVSAKQSGITVTWSATLNTAVSDTWPMYVDALTADAPPVSYTRPRQMLVT